MMNNNKNYIFNKDKMIVSFKTVKKSWTKKIESPNDLFASPAFIRGGFYFRGTINLDRFISAMFESFNSFEVLLSTLYEDSQGIPLITYTENIDNELLEVEEKVNDKIENYRVEDIVPTRIISREQQSGATGNLNGMKMSAFKITTFSNGFCIGFNISHSTFDQTGVYYYFKYLSQIYTIGSLDKVTLKKPEFIVFKDNDSLTFKDINEAHNYTNSNHGFYYQDPSARSSLSDSIVLDLEFNSKEIDNFKSNFGNSGSSDQTILSKNDIISAVIFKLSTYTSKLKDQDLFNLRYLCNIRKYAGLGEESQGNLFNYCTIPIHVSKARELSIIELAKINRTSVESISFEQFKKALCWYKYTQDNNHNNFHYFIPTIYSVKLSNWTQFSYEQIKFDNVYPYSLKPISKAEDATYFISFELNENNEKVITTSVSVSPDSINSIIELSNSTKLFKIINKIK